MILGSIEHGNRAAFIHAHFDAFWSYTAIHGKELRRVEEALWSLTTRSIQQRNSKALS